MKRRILKFACLSAVCLMIFLSNVPNGEMREISFQTEKPPMFVLQVGIRSYKNSASWYELKGAETDVSEMRKVLEGNRFNVPKGNFAEPLLNERATKKNILAAFEKHLIARAKEFHDKNNNRRDAVVLFQFSGHGTQVEDVAPNKDEADGFDEALVTWDSEDKANKNFDITDDEIFLLTQELGKYTENMVFILDSCYSGTGTRSGGESRSLKPRQTQPVFVPFLDAKKNNPVQVKSEKDNENTDLLPPSDNFIVISAARAGQRAGEMAIFEDRNAELPSNYHGRMTYHLLRGLRESVETTTYANLMDSVTRDVSGESGNSQTPQIEGETSRTVFGGLGKIEDNTIPLSIVKDAPLMVEAGAMQGVVKGVILEIRSKTGEKIGTAKITQAFAERAIFEVMSKIRDVLADDRAVVISRDLTAQRLRFLLDGDDTVKITANDKKLLENLQKKFTGTDNKSASVNLVKGRWNDRKTIWDIALLKDRFDKVFPDKSHAAPVITGKKENGEYIYDKFPSAETEIFYLVGKDLTPIHGFYVEADKNYTESVIETAVYRLMRLRSVKTIANKKSPLYGKVQIRPIRMALPIKCEQTSMRPAKQEFLPLQPTNAAYKFKIGEPFALEISNNSGRDLYITLLDIATDGSVQILFPSNQVGAKEVFKLSGKNGEHKKILFPMQCVKYGTAFYPQYFYVTPPVGKETFKILATTDPVQRSKFQFLEIEPLGAKGRGDETSLTSVGDWTTDEINFDVTGTQE